MVAEARTWVDVEGAVRQWARDEVGGAQGRVFFGYNEEAALPQVVLWRIGGPDDACRMQCDVWDATKAGAQSLAAQLATAADALSRFTHNGVRLAGALVEDVRWMPDEESDQPRYIMDIVFTAYPAGQ